MTNVRESVERTISVEELHEARAGRAVAQRQRDAATQPCDARRQAVPGDVRDDDGQRARVAREIVEVAADRVRGLEVDGDRDTGEREARGRQEPALQVPRDLQLALERILLGARRDASGEASGHVIEALDERRELVVAPEDGAVGEVALLDLPEADREPPRGARDAENEEARQGRREKEDEERRIPTPGAARTWLICNRWSRRPGGRRRAPSTRAPAMSGENEDGRPTAGRPSPSP